MTRVAQTVCVLSAVGCPGSERQIIVQDPPPVPCNRPLEEYCGGKPCQLTYEDAKAELRQLVRSGPVLIAAEGTGGRWRLMKSSDGFVGAEEYFDESGTLVSARSFTDVITNSACPGWSQFGPPPTCQETLTIDHLAESR